MKFKSPEGATPIDDAEGLIPRITTRTELNAAEAENILGAMDKHLKRPKNPKKPWLTDPYLRRVHKDMLGKVWKWAGHYRNTELNIGVSVHQMREEIKKLCDDVAFWDSQAKPMSVLERAVRIHHRLAQIHPFKNGNGRHARLIGDIYLYSHSHSLPAWPRSNIGEESGIRGVYLKALRQADQGHFKPLSNFVGQFITDPKTTLS